MEQRLLLAAVLVPALVWPACNGGTENLGEGGDGGSAGADLDNDSSASSTTTRGSGGGPSTSAVGSNSGIGINNAANSNDSGDAASGTSTGSGGMGTYGGSGYNVSSDGTLPDSGAFGIGTSAGGYGAGGYTYSSASSTVGSTGAGGGTYSAVNSGWGSTGAGGTGQIGEVYDGAYAFHRTDAEPTALINDAERLYVGGTALAAIPMPSGPATSLGEAPYQVQLAVDDTYLYVCSAGSLYRMSKNGGGTQNYQGAELDEHYDCRAVSVDDTMVHAAWYDLTSHSLRVRSWTKTDRTAPEDGLELDDLSGSYQPYLIANDALYYADRTSDELLLGRVALADYADETLLSVDAEFDSEYLQPLAAKGDTLYFQNCEQQDRWCSLFVQDGTDAEPTPYEHFQRDSVILSLVVYDEAVIVALERGIHLLETPAAELTQRWVYPDLGGYGPMLLHGTDLYFATKAPWWSYGSVLWRLPLVIEEG